MAQKIMTMEKATIVATEIFTRWDEISKRHMSDGSSGGLRPKGERIASIAEILSSGYVDICTNEALHEMLCRFCSIIDTMIEMKTSRKEFMATCEDLSKEGGQLLDKINARGAKELKDILSVAPQPPTKPFSSDEVEDFFGLLTGKNESRWKTVEKKN